MLEDLPKACDVGTKMNSKGYKKSWAGYKLYIDAADGHRQLSAKQYMSSATNHKAKAKAVRKYPYDYSMQKYIYNRLAY